MPIGKIPITNFNQGGLASSKFSGVSNSFYKLTGLDMHSQPGIIQAEQAMAKISSTTVDELCKVAVNSSNGAQYWFSADSGKVWEKTSGGTVRLVHTTTPAAGEAKCLGAAEYQGRIYWATQSRLHYITVANAGNNDWTSDAVEDFATFGVTDDTYHPMYAHPVQLILYIGDGNQLAQVENTTFSANALDIKTPLRIKSVGQIGTDVLLGTYVADNVTQTEIIRWNGYSVSFTSADPIPEIGINAFLQADNMVLVSAGTAGNIYYYDGQNLELYMKIPGNYSSTATATIHPYAVGNNSGQILFGVSNVLGNPCDQGVYRIARHDRNYEYIMDFPYPISELATSSIEVGAILVSNGLVYCSWKNGSTYGIDELDASTKFNNAYYETRVLMLDRDTNANYLESNIFYSSLPASTGISVYHDVNYAGYGSAETTITDTDRVLVRTVQSGRTFVTLQEKVVFTTNSNNSPQIEGGNIILK